MTEQASLPQWMASIIQAEPYDVDHLHNELWSMECKMSNASDFDKMRLLLKSFGVGFDYFNDIDNGLILRCSSGDKKINGVGGSFAQFEFDEDGKFVEMGAW